MVQPPADQNAQRHRYGQPNKIPAIQCAPWCTDGDGHTNATARDDQTCWGEDHPIALSLEEVHATPLENLGDYDIDVPKLTPCAYRGNNQLPCVYLHIWLPDRDTDTSAKLTAAEARLLAKELIAVADEIDGQLTITLVTPADKAAALLNASGVKRR